VSTDFCDAYAVPPEEDYGCEEGCHSLMWWTIDGTCVIRGECCILEGQNYCGT